LNTSSLRIAGTDVAYRLTGGGAVTVFITQSLGFASAEWWQIQDALSDRARVFTWDRPGYGDSGPPRSPRTVANIAREALDLLSAIAPEGPLILVGHSQGGLYTNALARLVGTRVQGAVLLDPAPPDNGRLRRELPPKLFRRSGSDLAVRLRMGRTVARLRLMGALKPLFMNGPPFSYCAQHPPEARERMWRHLTRARAYETALAEYAALEYRTDPGDLDALGPYPEVPHVVLVHDPEAMVGQLVRSARLSRPDAERVEALWGELLREAASLSPLAMVETIDASGHLIHLEKPELTVARVAGLVPR
jgi:pimeloyl-ACP methyl ester carboxylesterase